MRDLILIYKNAVYLEMCKIMKLNELKNLNPLVLKIFYEKV